MEKAILLTDDPSSAARVFPARMREELARRFAFCGEFTKESFHARPDKDVRYVFSTWGMPPYTADEIREDLPNLRAVFYAAGSVQGFARPFLQSGVRVFSAWGANAVPVAEYTAAQIVLAAKGFFGSARRYKTGGWPTARRHAALFPGNYDARVGIIGAGMIGKTVIERLRAYRLDVLVFDPFLSETYVREHGIRTASLAEIFETCDVISNHLANNDATAGMLDYACFSRMRPYAVFLNTGRGRQVVEADLVRALRECPDRTAVLDVTDPEPPEDGHPFYDLENVVLTPHIAGSSGNEVVRMAQYMLSEYDRFAAGEPTAYEVTLDMLTHMA